MRQEPSADTIGALTHNRDTMDPRGDVSFVMQEIESMTRRLRAQLWQVAVLTLAAAPVSGAPPKPIVARTTPSTWADLEMKAVKGRPARLAWSDDRATLYLQTVEGETQQTLRFHHYLVQKGGKPVAVDVQPKWVETYWKWKSAKTFAGDLGLRIDVETRTEILDNLNGIAANKAIYLSDSPIGVSGQDLMRSKQSGGTRVVNRLMLKGHVIGEFVDELIVPGYTFSWSPEELRLIVYRAQSGRLTIMDDSGRTETVAETKDVLLPAWSDDGAVIAYLERVHGSHFSIRVIEVDGQ